MTHPTREQLHQMAQEKSGELVQLVSELIQIPSENPTGSQRPGGGFCRELPQSGRHPL